MKTRHAPPAPAELEPAGTPGNRFAFTEGEPLHKVLGCDTLTIGASGVASRHYGQAYGSVAVAHHGPSSAHLTVMEGQHPGDTPPGGGAAVARVGPGGFGVFAISGHVVSIYGTPGDVVTLEAFTDVKPPTAASRTAAAAETTFATLEALPDQAGAGAVLTFTFSAPVALAVVEAIGPGLTARATAGATPQTPTAVLGAVCLDGSAVYMPVLGAVVQVFAPAGMTVSVIGYR